MAFEIKIYAQKSIYIRRCMSVDFSFISYFIKCVLYNKKLVSDAFVDDIERTKKAGMNEHFSKPLAMEKVIEAIGNYSKKITKI